MEQLPFIPNHVYKRRTEIHDLYGGNPQSGISSSAKYPYIFIFTGKSGHQYGYKDFWLEDNTVFVYTGEGQSGHMTYSNGNKALRDHLNNGKRVFLFEADVRGFVKFKTELELLFPYLEGDEDINGNLRDAIKFVFKVKTSISSIETSLILAEFSANYIKALLPIVTERTGLVTSRVGQGSYRNEIIKRWESKCAITGFDNLKILIASHILPWAHATDKQRLDVENGLLLSPNYDALFDKHLISFENNGKIILSDSIELHAFARLGVTGNESIKNLNTSNHFYLEHHRNRFSNKSQ